MGVVRVVRRVAVLAVAAGVLLPAGVAVAGVPAAGAGPAAAARPDRPTGLSVTLSDGTGQVRPDSEVTYRATLTNTGPKTTVRLLLSVPGYAVIRAAREARVTGLGAVWTVTVAPGGRVTRTARVRVGAVPAGQERVIGLLGVYTGTVTAAAVPLIRTADSDAIPGVAGGTAAAAGPATSRGGGGLSGWAVAGIAVGVVMTLVVAVSLVARRTVWRRSQTSPDARPLR